MILGCVDLSIGAIISFAAVLCAVLMAGQADNAPLAAAATLLVSAALGAVNGLLVVFNRSSSFILTLGIGARDLRAHAGLFGRHRARHRVAGLPRVLQPPHRRRAAGARACACCCWLHCSKLHVAHRRGFGRHDLPDRQQSRGRALAGLPVASVTFVCYVMSGLFAGLGGIALLARSGVSSTFTGRGFEFDALAAIVLGGTVFSGGRGSIVGTLAGVLVLFIAFNLVNILGLNYNLQLVAEGRRSSSWPRPPMRDSAAIAEASWPHP